MFPKNSDLILQQLRPTDVVLDIGGWAHPFNRANFIMDAEPYETRGYYNRTFARNHPIQPIGGQVEHFNRDRWIQRDICDKAPYPFLDKELDYIICSHTLEDIRDPLWVCSEMIRIGKAGYIEVPSRLLETCRGLEPGIAGLSHHRWLIDISGTSVRFVPKYHRIHNRRYSLPHAVVRKLTPAQKSQWLFWSDTFTYAEVFLHGESQLAALKTFVDSIRPYSSVAIAIEDNWTLAMSRLLRGCRRLAGLTHGTG